MTKRNEQQAKVIYMGRRTNTKGKVAHLYAMVEYNGEDVGIPRGEFPVTRGRAGCTRTS